MKIKAYPNFSSRTAGFVERLPAHWESKRLKYTGNLQLSNVDKKSVEGQEPVRLCNYVDVYKNERIISDMDFMEATATKPQVEKFRLRRGDVLLTKDSETPDDIAVPAVVDEDMENVLCGYHLAMIRPQADNEGRYLSRAIAAKGIREQFSIEALGVTRFGLGYNALGSVRLPLPPPADQRRIADFLDRETAKIDGLIAEKEKLIRLLEEKRKAVISQAVTKGVNPDVKMRDSGVPWLGMIPEHWQVTRLKYYGSVQLSNVDKKSIEGQGKVKLCNYVDVYKNEQITSDLDFMEATATKPQVEKFRLRRGDVLLTKDSETPDDIAVPAVVDEDMENVLCGYHLAMIRPQADNEGRYLSRAIAAKGIREQFFVEALGVTRYGLDYNAICCVRLPHPPPDEQRIIADFLDRQTITIDGAASECLGVIGLLRERRAALISAAVTGRIDVSTARSTSAGEETP